MGTPSFDTFSALKAASYAPTAARCSLRERLAPRKEPCILRTKGGASPRANDYFHEAKRPYRQITRTLTSPQKRPHSFLRETAVSSAKDRGLSAKRPRSFFVPSGVLSECHQMTLSACILIVNASFRLLFDNIGSSHEGLSQTIMRASSFAFSDALPLVQSHRSPLATLCL